MIPEDHVGHGDNVMRVDQEPILQKLPPPLWVSTPLLRNSPPPPVSLSPLVHPCSLSEEIIIREKNLGMGSLAGAAPAVTLPHPHIPKTTGTGVRGT